MASPERSPVRGRPRPRSLDWYIPDPRAVIPLTEPPQKPDDIGGFHIPRSLHRRLRSRRLPYVIRSDTAFEEVMRGCAEPRPGREDSWIDDQLIYAFNLLHRAGYAHCIEAWNEDAEDGPVLVGGVYGVAIGGIFCAESMFCRPEAGGTDASKVCLAYLARHLHSRGFILMDVQIRNHHTDQFGVVEIRASEYARWLERGLKLAPDWGPVSPKWLSRPNIT